jgi:hypothetical protein
VKQEIVADELQAEGFGILYIIELRALSVIFDPVTGMDVEMELHDALHRMEMRNGKRVATFPPDETPHWGKRSQASPALSTTNFWRDATTTKARPLSCHWWLRLLRSDVAFCALSGLAAAERWYRVRRLVLARCSGSSESSHVPSL